MRAPGRGGAGGPRGAGDVVPGAPALAAGPDLFGQVHPAVATEAVECTSCGRKVAAGRFAPHLEKCLGQGRQASRLGHRRDDGWG